MDDYPPSYVGLSRPLIVLSGWARPKREETTHHLSNGPKIGSGLPPISSTRGNELQEAFMSYDLGDNANLTNEPASQRSPLLLFRLKPCGRQYIFPCRKASPLASEVGSHLTGPGSAQLHSPLSPLSKGSPVYVDGIMTPLWPMKYHEAVPAVLLLFFSIGFDAKHDVLHDNHLKAEINAIKSTLTESNYRTRVAVVLIAEDSMRQYADVDERLANIRKAVKLDSKSTFFYLPSEARASDLAHFAEFVLSALRPVCFEFYKTHYKHSRRKKDKKGSSAPSTPNVEGFSQELPKSGWNIRYEYKMAVLSEFRLEMDTAARHHKEVIDLLMGPAGLFDLYSSWSPRWNELRLLADSSALRRIRCLLANGLPSSAGKYCKAYREMTRRLLERKGKGTSTYGWQAWEARFSRCMVEIIQSSFSQITDSNARKAIDALSRRQKYTYAPSEKIQQSDVFLPWELLHHPGYWLYLSARQTENRRTLAMAIPEEDQMPPGLSPASRVARRSEFYDTYLSPEPHLEGRSHDHNQEITHILKMALNEFAERNQQWMTDRLRFSIAEKLAQSSGSDSSVLHSLWQRNRWRRPGWGLLTKKVAQDLRALAVRSNDFRTQILTTWELLNSRLDKNNPVVYDLDEIIRKANDSVMIENIKSVVEVKDEDISSFCKYLPVTCVRCWYNNIRTVNLDFVFEKESENLGEVLRAQILIYSNAPTGSNPVHLSEIIINFHGNTINIHIGHVSDSSRDSTKSEILEVTLQDRNDESNSLLGEANLTIFPQQTRVLALSLPLRESGKLAAVKAMAIIDKPSIRLEYSKTLGIGRVDTRWHVMRERRLSYQRRFRWTSCQEANILPKLPKLKLRLPNLADEYYVGEQALIEIELVNEEAWDIEGSLEVRILGNHQDVVQPTIIIDSDKEDEVKIDTTYIQTCRIGRLGPSAIDKRLVAIQMPSHPSDDLNFEIEVQYNGTREIDSKVSKTMSAKLVIVEPINATFTVSPDVHPDPWPSFFTLHDLDPPPPDSGSVSLQGMRSRWNLQVNLVGIAADNLTIEESHLELESLRDGPTSIVTPRNNNQSASIAHDESHEVNFTIDITKLNLEDTSPSVFEPTLNIYWRRTNSTDSKRFKKVLAAPRLSLPSSEPRVIATRAQSEGMTVLIDIHLENPSMHYLSFEYGIDSSDDFAFSGSRIATVHLIPMSKHRVQFVLVPLVRGAYIQPMFKVVDVYFNKSLRVNAGSGLRRETAGNLLVWIDSEP